MFLTRWTITTKPLLSTNELSDREEEPKKKEKLPLNVMNNYFSIGADAKIALDFHAARGKIELILYLFLSSLNELMINFFV